MKGEKKNEPNVALNLAPSSRSVASVGPESKELEMRLLHMVLCRMLIFDNYKIPKI